MEYKLKDLILKDAQNKKFDILVLYNAVTFATDTHTGAFLR